MTAAEPRPERILTAAEMRRCERSAMEAGISGLTLMERAGAAVADAVTKRRAPCPAAVLCGPGNNGGDGFVTARLLCEQGWPVSVFLPGAAEALKGDAETGAGAWSGETAPLETFNPAGFGLIIDALFGAGLTRSLEGAAAEAVKRTAQARQSGQGPQITAVDVPSGVNCDNGRIMGAAFRADLTVTFHRLKPGHLLLPGRLHAGETVVADIGIPQDAEDALLGPALRRNGPEVWDTPVPAPRAEDHKYNRGHAVILGGADMTGAARLAARAARRTGAGLCTVAAPASAQAVYAAGEPGLLLDTADDGPGFAAAIADTRRNAVLIGPGAGLNSRTRGAVLAALKTDKAVVLDADALTVFADAPEALFAAVRGRAGGTVLTPHAGELARLFPDTDAPSKVERARKAARLSGAVVLLKGADTVIADPNSSPGGEALIDAHAPPDLATAGAGDVLAGTVTGLMAQGVRAFTAAAMAAWITGDAARRAGPGLIAEDLPEAMRETLGNLRKPA